MSLPSFDTAVTALKNTLLDNWAAKILTVNAARFPTIRSTTSSYTVPVAGTMDISVDGAAAVTVTPTEGVRTAAQLVTDFDAAVAALGCLDDSGVFEIRHGTAPSGETDRKVTITADTNGCAAALGFTVGDKAHRAPCRALPREKFYDYEPEMVGPPPYLILNETAIEGQAHLKTRAVYPCTVSFTIADAYRGGSYQPTRDLINGYVQTIREIIAENHSLNGKVISARTTDIQALPRLYQFEGKGPILGEASFTILIRVFNA